MTFTSDLAAWINWYSAARRDAADPLCMPEALQGLTDILAATIKQPSVSDDTRLFLVEVVKAALDDRMTENDGKRGALN